MKIQEKIGMIIVKYDWKEKREQKRAMRNEFERFRRMK